jgi:hypothetical protein
MVLLHSTLFVLTSHCYPYNQDFFFIKKKKKKKEKQQTNEAISISFFHFCLAREVGLPRERIRRSEDEMMGGPIIKGIEKK